MLQIVKSICITPPEYARTTIGRIMLSIYNDGTIGGLSVAEYWYYIDRQMRNRFIFNKIRYDSGVELLSDALPTDI